MKCLIHGKIPCVQIMNMCRSEEMKTWRKINNCPTLVIFCLLHPFPGKFEYCNASWENNCCLEIPRKFTKFSTVLIGVGRYDAIGCSTSIIFFIHNSLASVNDTILVSFMNSHFVQQLGSAHAFRHILPYENCHILSGTGLGIPKSRKKKMSITGKSSSNE